MKPSKKELLRINKEFYNLHAEEFSSKRNYQWDSFCEIKKYIKKKDNVLDIGCGNGRFSLNVDKDYYLGIDSSSKLINIAKEKYKEKKFLIRDISIDGWSNDLAKFDIVLLIATLHHIPKHDLRLRIMKDIRSVTNKYFIFSIWNFDESKITDNLGEGDYLLSWNKEEDIRYVHKFQEDEILSLISDSNFSLVNRFVMESNEYFILN